MKNRAKCKLCKDVLESFHRYDHVSCSCGEISIDGGSDIYGASARNFDNFLRLDDEDNEIPVIYKEEDEKLADPIESAPLSKKEKIDMLDSMIKNIENLPLHAMQTPINHYDLLSFMTLLSSIVREG